MLGGKIYCYYPMGSRGVITPPPAGLLFNTYRPTLKELSLAITFKLAPGGKKVAIQQEEKNHVFFTWDLFLDLDLT